MIFLFLPSILLSSGEDGFIKLMATKYQFDSRYIQDILSKATFKPKTLKIYNTPFKSYKNDASWTTYETKIITDKKIKSAKKFIKKYENYLQKAQDLYLVPKEYIAAFIGVESNFGSITGRDNIFDSLTTLSFYPNRKKEFFKNELVNFLIMCRSKAIDPLKQKGSFAGAMGCVQQLPSVHLKYGVDLNGDGDKNLYDMVDCIGTIANFMHQNGWQNGKVVTVKAVDKGSRYSGLRTGYNKLYSLNDLAKYGITPKKKFDEEIASLLQLRGKNRDELWLGAKNFRVLTNYNNSTNYGMAIHNIAQMIKKSY